MTAFIISSGPRTVCIERDLGCVPIDLSDAAGTQSLAVAAANTTKLQTAFDAASEITSRSYAFTGPHNRSYAIGTTTLLMYSGQALVGQGGFSKHVAEGQRLGRTALPNDFQGGFSLTRVTPSTNAMLRLEGYGNVISGVNLRGCLWLVDAAGGFRNTEVADVDYPYFAGVGIDVRNRNEISGHHIISAGMAFCTKGINFNYSGVQNQADVSTMPHVEFYECPNAVTINNEQSIQHHFGHLYYQAPSMTTAAATPSASCSIFDCVNGGGFSVSNLAAAGTTATTTGEFIVVKGGIMQTNNCCVTVGQIFMDATIFNKGRKFRLAKMVDTSARDLFMSISGGEFAFGDAVNFTDPEVTHDLGLGEQWYNDDNSNIVLNSSPAANINIKARIFGLSTADAITYAW